MERIDGRALSVTALEERRRTIIRMKENGFSVREIVIATGCSRKTVYPLWNEYEKKGNKSLEAIVKVETRGISLATAEVLPRSRKTR